MPPTRPTPIAFGQHLVRGARRKMLRQSGERPLRSTRHNRRPIPPDVTAVMQESKERAHPCDAYIERARTEGYEAAIHHHESYGIDRDHFTPRN